MTSYFEIGAPRRLEIAQRSYFPTRTVHPSREHPGYHDIFYIDNGSWDIMCEGKYYELHEGDVVVLPAESSYKGISLCTEGTKTFFMHIVPTPGDTAGNDIPDDGITRLPLETVIHCQHNPAVRELFEEIAQLYNSNLPESPEMQSVLVQALICMLNKCSRQNGVNNCNIVHRCIDIMNQSPNVIFKEKDMAQRLFVTTKTLRAGFRRMYGKTFYEYQLDNKLGDVCLMLSDHPDMKLREIAYSLGFCDEFHLSKVFKKKYGVSPNQYKNKTVMSFSAPH